MYEDKKLELRLRAFEAQADAQSVLLTLLARALIDGTPNAPELRAELQKASAYEGPSTANKALAQLAAQVLGGG